MAFDRRSFLKMASLGAVLGASAGAEQERHGDDPLGVRQQFPICRDEVFLNSAYIAPSPIEVEEAAKAFIGSKSRHPLSLDEMLAKTDVAREKFARLVGVDKEEIGFIFSTSEGENIIAQSLRLRPGDNIVIDELAYTTTFLLYRHLEETVGIELRIAKQNEGTVSTEAIERLVDKRTRLVSVSWVSHKNGFCHDMKALAELAHSNSAYLYADAIQAIGAFPVNPHQENIDFFASGTYKWLLAGFGVAPFYIRQNLLESFPPDRWGAFQVEKRLPGYRFEVYRTAKKYEYSTLAFEAVYQLEAALDFLHRVGVERIGAHTIALTGKLHKGLSERGFEVSTPPGNRSSIVSFFFKKDPATVEQILKREKISVTLRKESSEIRVSVSLFNNDQEIQRFLETAVRF
ncbi:MAG: aminotransferase class V-fold PLP-dependent enzyme, partial [Candidatus Aminicenantales bacterium]